MKAFVVFDWDRLSVIGVAIRNEDDNDKMLEDTAEAAGYAHQTINVDTISDMLAWLNEDPNAVEKA